MKGLKMGNLGIWAIQVFAIGFTSFAAYWAGNESGRKEGQRYGYSKGFRDGSRNSG